MTSVNNIGIPIHWQKQYTDNYSETNKEKAWLSSYYYKAERRSNAVIAPPFSHFHKLVFSIIVIVSA